MTASILLLALALQTTTIPLDQPSGQDDFPFAPGAFFTPSGDAWWLPHWSGSIVKFDLGSLSPVASVPLDRSVYHSAISPDGTKVIIVQSYGVTTVLTFPGFVPLVSAGTLGGELDRFVINQTSTLAFAVGSGGGLQVVDLITGARVGSFHTPGNASEFGGIQAGLASDDLTWVTIGRYRIKAFDTSTGLLSANVPLGPGRIARQIALNPAGTRAHVLVQDDSTAVTRLAVDVFDLPSLNPISSTPTTITGADFPGGGVFSMDDAERRAVITNFSGAYLVDLATGNATVLSSSPTRDAEISTDGSTAAVVGANELWIFDGSSGQLQATRTLLPSADTTTLVRHPRRPLFLMTSLDDRIDVVERTGPGTYTFLDVNSGVGAEVDGQRELLELPDGERAVVVHDGSDQLSVVDVDGQSVLGRIGVERDPVAVAALADGHLAVAHGRGKSVVFVDPDSLSISGRVDLLAPATAIASVPGTSQAWIQVMDAGQRALQLVDATSASIIVSVPLSTPSAPYVPNSLQPDIAFDFPNDHAIVTDAGAGTVLVVELSTGSILGSATFTGGRAAQAFPDADGLRVTVTSSMAETTSWRLTLSGLVQDWQYRCTTSNVGIQSSASGQLSLDGTRLIVDMPTSGFPQPPGTCPNTVTLDTSTGQVVTESTSGSGLIGTQIDGGNERISASYNGLQIVRFNGIAFELLLTLQDAGLSAIYNLKRGAVSGRTLASAHPGPSSSDPWNQNLLAIVDPLFRRRQFACDPAVPNATGSPASLELEGGGLATGRLAARVTGLEPQRMVGYLLVADTLTSPMPAAGSQGVLCLGGSVGRYADQVQRADASGQQRYQIDLNTLPISAAPAAAQPGETWSFQSWYRDVSPSGTPTSNFSSAVAVQIL